MRKSVVVITAGFFLSSLMFFAWKLHANGADPQNPNTPPSAQAAPGPAENRVAFWYEQWRPEVASKFQPSSVIVGVADAAVPAIHQGGGKAIQYITFYQAKAGTFFLKNTDDLANVGFQTAQGYLPSAFGGKDNYVLCSDSAEVLRRALDWVARSLDSQHFDGFFVDNSYLPPATTLSCDSRQHTHRIAGAKGGPAYIDLMKQVYSAVKAKNPSAIVILNPGSPRSADQLTNGSTSAWDVADYITWESYGWSSAAGAQHDRWTDTLKESFRIAGTPHASKVVALSYPRTYREALYSYAIATAFGFTHTANIGESEKDQLQATGGHFGVFAPSLPVLTGKPVDQPPATSDVVLKRKYKNGMVVANTGTTPARFTVPQGGVLYSDKGNSPVRANTTVNVLPSDAVVLVYQ